MKAKYKAWNKVFVYSYRSSILLNYDFLDFFILPFLSDTDLASITKRQIRSRKHIKCVRMMESGNRKIDIKDKLATKKKLKLKDKKKR